jgi:hypothetical protein
MSEVWWLRKDVPLLLLTPWRGMPNHGIDGAVP